MKTRPDSLLAKILGVFEVKISGKDPIKFYMMENIIENDFSAVKRCYDLKGSKFQRKVDLDVVVEISGESGLKILKDQNFLEHVQENDKINIEQPARDQLLETLKSDSKFLQNHGLIDYSVLLIEIDRQKLLKKSDGGNNLTQLVWDVKNRQMVMKEIDSLNGDEAELQNYILRKKKTLQQSMSQQPRSKAVSKFKKSVFMTIE